MYKLQYFDADGDVCEKDFSSHDELEKFANRLPVGWVIGIVIPENEQTIGQFVHEEYVLLNMKFPTNKIN